MLVKKNNLLIILNLCVFFYSLSYIVDFFNHKLIEGYELVISAIVFDVLCFSLLIYFNAKKRIWETKFILYMIGVYTVSSFMGSKIAMFVTAISSLVFITIALNKSRNS